MASKKRAKKKASKKSTRSKPAPRHTAPSVPLQEPGRRQVDHDFSQYHVHFGIPCYGGQITEPCFTSILKFILLANSVGLQWSLDTMVNESLVTRARNNLMAKMMTNKKATHFMFVDADIRFESEAIFQMLMAEKDVIGGLYPKKSLPISYVINAKDGTKIEEDGTFKVDTMGTGFMLFKREVYQKLIDAHPELKYCDDVGLGKEYEPNMYSIFDTLIDDEGHYLSEDWTFCRRWGALGGDVHAHAGVLLNHCGHYEFAGDLEVLTGQKVVDPSKPRVAPTAPKQTGPVPIVPAPGFQKV
jgi:hypothetical protein